MGALRRGHPLHMVGEAGGKGNALRGAPRVQAEPSLAERRRLQHLCTAEKESRVNCPRAGPQHRGKGSACPGVGRFAKLWQSILHGCRGVSSWSSAPAEIASGLACVQRLTRAQPVAERRCVLQHPPRRRSICSSDHWRRYTVMLLRPNSSSRLLRCRLSKTT